MAPPARPRHTRIPKEKFSVYFGHLKSQPYIEAPAGRGAGSHHRCVCACACARLSLRGPSRERLVSEGKVHAYDHCCCSLRSIAWNPLGTLVATGSSDKTLRVCEFPCCASPTGRSKLTGIRGRESREAQCPFLDRAQGPLGWDREDSFQPGQGRRALQRQQRWSGQVLGRKNQDVRQRGKGPR